MLPNEVPVLLLTFNRPDVTKQLINQLRLVQSKHIFIAQDWPRDSKEQTLTEDVKKIFDDIDRDCEINTLYRDNNLWCYEAVTSGISRFFDQVDFWIILEDDCIPNQSFFELCAQIYDQKMNLSPEIGLISGSNFQTQSNSWNLVLLSEHTPLLRGRATRKEKWQLFSQHKKIKSDFISGKLAIHEKWWLTKKAMKHYILAGYWDNDWYLTCYFNHLLTIVPDKNHISNLWFVGIHNARPWAYHWLQCFNVKYWSELWELSISKDYNNTMIYFMKKMYIYGMMEKILKKIWLFSFVKRIILSISKLFYLKKLTIHNA